MDLDFGQGFQQFIAAGIGLDALPQMTGCGTEIFLDHRQAALRQKHLGRADHGLGPLENLVRLGVHLLDGQSFGNFQIDSGGAILHAFFVVEVRKFHLVLEVLGVELHDLGEFLEGPLDEALLGEEFRHGEMHLQRVLDHAHLAVHIRQPPAHVQIVRRQARGFLQNRDAFLGEAVPFIGHAQPFEHVYGLADAFALNAEIPDAIHQGQIFGIVIQELAVLLDGLINAACRQIFVGILGNFGTIDGHGRPGRS